LRAGFFRIHQLDVLNKGQDCTHLEILGQALAGTAHSYFWEQFGGFLGHGKTWDFRGVILNLQNTTYTIVHCSLLPNALNLSSKAAETCRLYTTISQLRLQV
jgi:hypothetical protein